MTHVCGGHNLSRATGKTVRRRDMEDTESDDLTVTDVIEALDDPDPSVVRDALDPVTEGEVVTLEAIETTVSDTSKLLATAETRIELAGDACD